MSLFIDSSSIPEHALKAVYDPVLVALSFLIAVVASYVALHIVARLRSGQDPKSRKRHLFAAAGCLGGGIWSMHFVGMLACGLPMDISYRLLPTLLSLAIAVAFTGYGFSKMTEAHTGPGHVLLSGTIMGLGISLMHYMGMAAIQISATQHFKPGLMITSVVIAIVAATAALAISFKFCEKTAGKFICFQEMSALVMGLAVTGMHYTGMAAAVFIPVAEVPFQGKVVLDSDLLAFGTAGMMAVLLSLAVITSGAMERLNGRQRLGALVLIMSVLAFSVSGITLYILFESGFEARRMHLLEMVKSQARLMDAMGRFDKKFSNEDVHGGAFLATLSQIRDAHSRDPGFGQTGEINLGWLQHQQIEFLLKPRNWPGHDQAIVPWDSRLAEPMRRALKGQTGTIMAKDYRAIEVLAAYTAVPELGVGIVAKVDAREIRRPFIEAGLTAGGVAIIAILLGSGLFYGISTPMIRRLENEIKEREIAEQALEKSQGDLSKAEEVARLGNWVWEIKTNEVRWSDETFRILGFAPGQFNDSELVGKFPQTVHPDDLPMVDKAIDEAVRTGVPYSMEHRVVWPDGTVRFVHGRSDLQRDAHGEPLKMVGTVQDITDRKKAQEEVIRLTQEKDRMESELEFATLVQEGFLPEKPPAPPGFLFAAKTVPAKFVGGDFYDFIDLGNQKLGIVLGDVSGKGVSAALFMAQLLSDFRYVSLVDPSPAGIMAKVNDIICRRSRRGMFATAIYLLLDLENKTLVAANAGHHPLLVRHGDTILKGGVQGGTPLGVLPETQYQEEQVPLEPNDMVLLFTDGATDAVNENKEMFGNERLYQVMRNATGSPEDFVVELQNAIYRFSNEAAPFDDLTLVAFKAL